MVKYTNIIYFVFAVFILGFGITTLANGAGKLWADIGIVLIGLYFLYRGIAVTVNNKRRRELEEARVRDKDKDPANA